MSERNRFHIVCPLSGSERAESILPAIMPLVRGGPCQVTLLEVRPEPGRHPQDERYLAKLRDGLRAHQILAEDEIRTGEPVEQILAFLEDSRADLVALATQGRTGISRMLRPSLVEELLRRADVPVLVGRAKQRIRPWRRILVPLDPSVGGECLLEDVAFLARTTGSTVELLESVPPDLPASYGSNELWRRAYGPGPQAITSALGGLAQRLRGAGVQVSCSRGWILSTSGILDRAREGEIDLICMTTHGRTGLPRFVLGSIAEEVVRLAPCPVFVRRIGGHRWGTSGRVPAEREGERPAESRPNHFADHLEGPAIPGHGG